MTNGELQLDISPIFTKNLDAYLAGNEFILNIGGSGSGKSYSVLILLLYLAISDNNKLVIDICRKTFPTVKSTVLNDFIEILTKYKLWGMCDYNMTDSIFKFKNGTVIRFYSLDDSLKLRGKKRDIVFIDEINENDYETFSQIQMRSRRCIIAAMNPSEDEEHWVYNVIKGEKTAVFRSTHLDNPFLSETIRRKLLDFVNVDYNKYLVYTLGLPPVNNVRVYTHFQKYIDEPVNVNRTVYGLDFGFNHVTCLVKVQFVGEKIYARQVIYENKLTSSTLIAKMNELNVNKNTLIFADGSRPEMIEELKRAGFNVFPASKSVKDGIDYIKSKEVFLHADSTDGWKEFKAYTWIVKGDKITDEPNKALDMDNFMDSLRYAVYSSRKKGSGKFDYDFKFI